MKLVKIKTVAGKDVYIKTDALVSVSQDIMNPEYTMIVFGAGLYYTIKMSVEDTNRLVRGPASEFN